MMPPKPTNEFGGEMPAFQMLWDCKFCGTKKLLGVDQKFCPNCGAAQEPAMRYFPSEEDKRTVSDPNYKYAGADRMCPFCQTPNSAAANFCKQCGGDLSGAKEAERRQTIEAGSAQDSGQAEDLVLKKFQQEQAQIKAAGKGGGGAGRILIAIAVIVVIAVVGLIALSRSTYAASFKVSEVSWERIIYVERLTAQSGSGWQESVPGDAYNRNCSTRQREYQKSETYQCGTTRVDRGDGSFIEQPKYCSRMVSEFRPDTFCTYTVNRWVSVNELRTSGMKETPLVWPAFTATGGNSVGAQRESSRKQTLRVKFVGLGDKQGSDYTYEPETEAEWQQFAVSAEYSVEINRLEQVQWNTLKALGPR